jgi:hypothetical protein
MDFHLISETLLSSNTSAMVALTFFFVISLLTILALT